MSEIEKPDWIVAERRTPIKPGTDQASRYEESDLIWVSPEDKYFISEYEQAPGGHWKVLIDDVAFPAVGHRYIYDGEHSHWLTSWETDKEEKEIQSAPAVISTISKDAPVGAALRPEMPFSTRITPNITYGEFALYQEARRFNYKHQCHTAYVLAMFMEECRKEFGGNPIVITSGHRPPLINAQCGGAKYSEHLFSAPLTGAVDFYIKNVPVTEAQDYCDRYWANSVGYGARRGFVHLGCRGKVPRRIRWNY